MLEYRVLAFTSKNEFYVIDVNKSKKSSPSITEVDDEGIQMNDNNSDDDRDSSKGK